MLTALGKALKRRYVGLLLFAISAGLVAVGVVSFVKLRDDARAESRADLVEVERTLASDVTDGFHRGVQAVVEVAAYMQTRAQSGTVLGVFSQHEYLDYANDLEARDRLIGLTFAAAVPPSQRAEFVAEARQRLDKDFAIKPLPGAKEGQRSIPTDEFVLPIVFLQPDEPFFRSLALGGDMASIRPGTRALERSFQTGKPQASGGVQIGPLTRQPTIAIVAPVYNDGMSSGVETKHGRLL